MAWLLNDSRVLAAVQEARTIGERSRGLLGRTGYDGALVLHHTRAVHTFGMRFPLDVAFCDREMVVLTLRRLKPYRIAMPALRARCVVEAEAGAFERWGLQVGDRLEIRE